MKKQILIVGEDQPLWRDLRSSLLDSETFEAHFVRTRADALIVLEPLPFAAVVADVQLCDGSGLELLDEAMQIQPRAARILLSEDTHTLSCLPCVGKVHHHLTKPCEVSTFLDVLQQAVTPGTWLFNQAVPGLIAQIRQVPSPPTIYLQITSEADSPDVSIGRIGDLIARDPAVAAKVLQLANSTVFGLRRKVVRPVDAVAHMGLETTKALVLLAHTFAYFDHLQLGGFCVESLCCHSLMVGRFAQRISQLEKSGREVANHAFTAGLLHDIGKLLFAANLPEQFGKAMTLARQDKIGLWEAESRTFGASHAELGGHLLSIWGLPTAILEAVVLHHCPGLVTGQRFTALTAVHAANVLAHEAWSDQPLITESELDMDYLKHLELNFRIEEWQHHCLTPVEAAEAESSAMVEIA